MCVHINMTEHIGMRCYNCIAVSAVAQLYNHAVLPNSHINASIKQRLDGTEGCNIMDLL